MVKEYKANHNNEMFFFFYCIDNVRKITFPNTICESSNHNILEGNAAKQNILQLYLKEYNLTKF